MRRLLILFSMALVFALLVVAAATAAAPDFCNEASPKYNPDHPSCSTEPPVTTTTQPSQLEVCETTFTIAGKGGVGHECLWTPTNDGSEVATVTVSNIEGAIKKAPVVFVRDDAPGDICALEQGWPNAPGAGYEVSFDLAYEDVPVGYDDWSGTTYWDFFYDNEAIPTAPVVGAYWCAPQDPVLDSLRLDTNGTPLHLSVGFNAGKGGQLDITLSPAQDTD